MSVQVVDSSQKGTLFFYGKDVMQLFDKKILKPV